jgi:hypothetical protein
MTPTQTATEFHPVPPNTLVEASGDGQAFELSSGNPRLFVLEMEISETIEQESLDLSLWGSADGQDWGTMPLFKFPQRFYAGSTRMALDLSSNPDIRFIRARWELNRWGRGVRQPRFRFGVRARPVEARSG